MRILKGEKELKHRLSKGLTIIVIILFIGISVIPSTGRLLEKSYTVSFDGNIFYVGGSGPGNYTKIQDAIDDASDGDTVFVYNGTYGENLIMDKSINLIGEDKETTVIDGGGIGDVIYVYGDLVNINGLTIKNSGNNYNDVGIRIVSNNNFLEINIIKWNNANGIIINSYNNIIIKNEIKSNSLDGILIYGFNSYNNTISCNNIILNGQYGIRFHSSSSNNTIFSNMLISNTEDGIVLAKETSNNWVIIPNIQLVSRLTRLTYLCLGKEVFRRGNIYFLGA